MEVIFLFLLQQPTSFAASFQADRIKKSLRSEVYFLILSQRNSSARSPSYRNGKSPEHFFVSARGGGRRVRCRSGCRWVSPVFPGLYGGHLVEELHVLEADADQERGGDQKADHQ